MLCKHNLSFEEHPTILLSKHLTNHFVANIVGHFSRLDLIGYLCFDHFACTATGVAWLRLEGYLLHHKTS